jgi:lipoate-protein ligase A
MADKKHVDYKVPGGKMIRLEAEVENGVIKSIRMTGDFFIHPEAAIEGIERFLMGKKVSEGLAGRLDGFVRRKNIRMIGISAADVAAALFKAR